MNWDEPDEDDFPNKHGARGRPEPDSDDTDSDDIEKNYNQGYRPINSRDNSPTRGRGAPGMKIPAYGRVAGKGHHALDNDDSVTVTESDESEHPSNLHPTGVGSTMKAVYPSTLDGQLEPGEIDPLTYQHQNDSNKSGSNYENDEFEDEDLDDDFSLPKEHLQNNESYGQVQPNIGEQMKKQKGLGQQPIYTSTGSQATQDFNRPRAALEEEKQPHKAQNNVSRASKEQLVQNREMQKEVALRKVLKKRIQTMKDSGIKANQDGDLDRCYLFIRSISTFTGFEHQKRIKEGSYEDQACLMLHQNIYEALKKEQQSKLMDDLLDPQSKSAKQGHGNQQNQGNQTNPSKKNKKKSKKDKAPKEGGEKTDNQATTRATPAVQDQKIEVVEDVVLISSEPPAEDKGQPSSEQPAESTKPKKSIRSRKNKKKKKAVNEEEAKATEDAEKQAEEED